MGMSYSELLEELLIECYNLNIIDEVRKEAIFMMDMDRKMGILEAYEIAFEKISKKN